MGSEHVAMERKWQRRWTEARLGEAEPDSAREKFFIIFAYPGVSGYLHVGHMRGYTYTDVISRYKRMCGYNVLFPVGTHATGNISINFAKKVEDGDERWLEYLRANGCPEDQIPKLRDPAEVVRYFSNVYIEDYWKRFGFLVDWRRFTTTIDDGYMRFIQWQFLKLNERDLLTQKPYYATYCPTCGPVAVDPSETDISKGGNAEKQEYTLLKFELGGEFLVAATLRPETVFGQTNFWADPGVEYVRAKVGGESWIISRECAEKLKLQKDDVEITGTIPGKELIGKTCLAPMIKREIPVLPSRFCDPAVGTGLVTSVPSDAPYDWIALRDLQRDEAACKAAGLDCETVRAIEPIPIIKSKGWGDVPAQEICEKLGIESQDDSKLEEATQEIYKAGFHTGVLNDNCGEYAGQRVERAKDLVKEEMLSRGEASTMYDLSEEVICRCGAQVMVKRVDDQWFIRYSDETLTQTSKDHGEVMNIQPREYFNNLPGILDWFEDRACARQGNWLGTPFPLDERWTIEPISDSTLYPAYYLISLYVKGGQLAPEQMTESFFDHVFLDRGSVDEVASETGVDAALIERVKGDVGYWYPLDINLGGKEHMTVHFPVFEMNHIALLPPRYWPRGIFVNWYIIGRGSKISKSKGGAEPIPDAVERYSVDGLRLYYCHSASPFVDVEWSEEAVDGYKVRIEKLLSLVRQITAISGPEGGMDRWLLSRCNRHIQRVRESMDSFDLRAATNALFFDMASDVRWYLNRGGGCSETLSAYADRWLRALAPFIPHNCEEAWEELGRDGLISVAPYPEVVEGEIDGGVEMAEQLLRDTLADVREILKVTQIAPQRVVLYTSPSWKRKVYKAACSRDLSSTKPGDLIKEMMVDPDVKSQGKLAAKYIPQLLADLKKTPGSELRARGELIDEKTYLGSAVEFMSREIGCPFEVHSADAPGNDPKGKAKSASPWRPAIYIE